MPAFLQAAASSGLIGREASEMSVSPAQKRWNPPPVPATPTVMSTRGLVVAKRSAASCMSGPTVLEPSALIDPVRFVAGPAGRLTAEEPCGRPPQALAATATATATSASGADAEVPVRAGPLVAGLATHPYGSLAHHRRQIGSDW